MGDFWRLLSVNSDLEGLEFVSSMEARDYPFYALQVTAGKKYFDALSNLQAQSTNELSDQLGLCGEVKMFLAKHHSFFCRANLDGSLKKTKQKTN